MTVSASVAGTILAAAAACWLRGIPDGFHAARGLAALALIALAAAAGGLRSLRRLAPEAGPGERALLGTSLGLGLLSLGAFALAAVGALGEVSIGLLVGGALLWGFPEVRGVLLAVRARAAGARIGWAPGLMGGLALGLLWPSLAPPHQYDSLVYHLTLPETYLRDGGLSAPAHLLYAHFPQNGEMLFTIALALGGDLAAQGTMWLATLLTLGLVYVWGRRQMSEGAARLACLLLATHTSVMLLAAITYVEALVMLWVTAAVLCWWDYARSGGWRRLIVSAVFCGLALGAKYNAGIAAALLGAATFFRSPRRKSWREALLFTVVVTSLFLPWMIKNAMYVGNPFFPFFYKWFPVTAAGWHADTAERYFRVFTEYGHKGNWLKDFVTLPVQILRDNTRYGGGMDALGSLGWGLVLLAAPLGAWLGRGNPFLRALSLYGGLHFLAWFSTGVVLRFLTVLAPILALLAAGGVSRLWSLWGPAGRGALAAVVAGVTAWHLWLFIFVHGVFQTGSVLWGGESRESFLSRRLDYHPCAAYVRARLTRNDRILVAGDQRAYGIGRDHVASTIHAPNRFVGLANASGGPQGLAGALKGDGFTHVLFVPREFDRLGTAWGDFTPEGRRAWEGLVSVGSWAFAARGCALLALPPGPVPSRRDVPSDSNRNGTKDMGREP